MNYFKEIYNTIKEVINDPLRKKDLEAYIEAGNPKTPEDITRLEEEFNRYWGNNNKKQ